MWRNRLRRISLTERVARLCRLRPADRDYLLTYHGHQIDVMPTGQPGHYRLTPGGWVGVIQAPYSRFRLRPKLAVRHLFHMLDPTQPLPPAGPLAGTEVLDFLTARFVQLLRARVQAGLRRGYVERSGPTRFLQGSLDLPAQLLRPRLGNDLFHCRHDEFTLNIPSNRIPFTIGERLAENILVAAPLRTELRQLLCSFEEVKLYDLTVEPWPEPDAAYNALFDLCRMLARASTNLPSFLLPMDRVFERYVCEGWRRLAPSGQRVLLQPTYRFAPEDAGPDIVLRPDAVILRQDEPQRVVDAKWKRAALPGADLQQMLAYCQALGVRQGTLVYPGRRERIWRYRFGDVLVEVCRVRVVGSPEECQRSLERLVSH